MKAEKQIITCVLIALQSVLAFAQTPSETNYILSIEPLAPMSTVPEDLNQLADNEKKVNIMYYDGLGREKQLVEYKQTLYLGVNSDLITHYGYDEFGRRTKEYLPLPTRQLSGAYIPSPLSGYDTYYTGEYNTQVYYSEKELEASPLNRVLDQAAPGDAWAQGSGKEIKFQYLINTDYDNVRYYYVTSAGDYTPTLQKGSNYKGGLLYKTVVTDENGNDTEEYKNKIGQVLLKRTFIGSSRVDTYYVYDKFGNLTFVIPPLAADKPSVTEDVRNGLCYQYKYDQKNRLTDKKLPGKGWEYMVYDTQDRLVATQDAVQRTNKNWLFIKYDKFGRVVYTGIVTGTRTNIQNAANTAAYNNNEIRDGRFGFTKNGLKVSYTTTAFPTTFDELLTVNYYDDYNFDGALTTPSTVLGTDVINDTPDPQTWKITTRGLSVAVMVRILGTDTWEKNFTYYDTKQRPVRVHKLNQLGGKTVVDTQYDFRGKVLKTITSHQRTDMAPVIETEDNFTYTQQERLLTHTHKINNGTAERIANNSYDPLGQLVKKGVGNTAALPALQAVDYKYNIRGWLTDINNIASLTQTGDPIDLFTFRINYNNPVQSHFPASAGIVPLFNGNIAETFWKTASDNILRGYGYKYDELNRLLDAHYQKPNAAVTMPGNYDEFILYDKNGNITTLHRRSGTDIPTSSQLTDQLFYTYFDDSNQLKKVTDSTNSTTGFSNGNSGDSDDYAYDENGNMISDLNKSIESIAYNHLNLPTMITWTPNKKIEYIYNAAGVKVQKKVTNGSIITTDYLDGFQYNNNFLEFFPTAEGYVKVTAMAANPNAPSYSYNYVYNYTDHLGNIRISYTKDPATGNLKILDESHYYPFGLKHQHYNTLGIIKYNNEVIVAPILNNPFKYKYNGKEWQDELGLGWYDYHARNYDPALGRWMNIDPMAPKYFPHSPYGYALNNPVYFIDPDGMQVLAQDSGEPIYEDDIIELDTVIIKPKPKESSSAGSSSGSSWAWLPDIDASNAFFGSHVRGAYNYVLAPENKADYLKMRQAMHEGQLSVAIFYSAVVALPYAITYGSVALGSVETSALISSGQTAIANVIRSQYAKEVALKFSLDLSTKALFSGGDISTSDVTSAMAGALVPSKAWVASGAVSETTGLGTRALMGENLSANDYWLAGIKSFMVSPLGGVSGNAMEAVTNKTAGMAIEAIHTNGAGALIDHDIKH